MLLYEASINGMKMVSIYYYRGAQMWRPRVERGIVKIQPDNGVIIHA